MFLKLLNWILGNLHILKAGALFLPTMQIHLYSKFSLFESKQIFWNSHTLRFANSEKYLLTAQDENMDKNTWNYLHNENSTHRIIMKIVVEINS